MRGTIVGPGRVPGARAVCTLLAAAALLATGIGRADAQISGAANSTTGSSCSAANSADRSCQFSVALTASGPTTVSSRYRWNISTDVGTLGNTSMTGTAQHNVSFNVTVNGGYRLDVSQQRIGEMRRVDDCGIICIGDNGGANVSGVAGSQSGGTLTSGSLNLADVADNPAKGTAIDINQSQAAAIHAVSNGAPIAHSMSFVQSGGTSSAADETALRMGANSTVTGCGICGNRSPDNDGHFVSVTVVPLCGNGVIDASVAEQCDQGGANGSPTSCCSANCTFKTAGTTCRAGVDLCDAPEVCSGAADTCPADVVEPPTTVCRASSLGEVCDVEEFCDGVTTACPADAVEPNTTVCRGSAGVCDIADTCDGANKTCPADAFEPNTTTCRASGGVCDLAETCTGSGAACPADGKSTAVCRGSAGSCDVAESCDGVGNDCPADAVQPASFTCRSVAGICDVAEQCDGVGVTCPADDFVAGGTECRAVADICDVAEQCTGSSAACPTDAFEPNTTVCRPSSVGEVCDIAESCTGSSAACPADAVEPNTTVCRGSAGVCDIAETCDGSGKLCPSDTVEPNTTVCRASSIGEVCDIPESCDGVGVDCPADAVEPNTTVCRAAAGVCDAVESCDGSSKFCAGDAKLTTVCRADAGACDVAESCDGVGDDCPSDTLEADNTPCADGTFCNGTETCQSGVCSPGTNPCPMGESCDEGTQLCFLGNCPSTAAPACLTATKSKLLIKNNTDDTKDKFVWKFSKGQAFTQGDFGDPTTTSDYTLCFYAGTAAALINEANITAGAPLFSAISTKGYKYKDPARTQFGISKVLVKGGTLGKTKALAKGKGAGLVDFTLPLNAGVGQPVIVQLRNEDTGKCLTTAFDSPKKDLATQFNAKEP